MYSGLKYPKNVYLHPWNLYETISNEVKDPINFYENIAVDLNALQFMPKNVQCLAAASQAGIANISITHNILCSTLYAGTKHTCKLNLNELEHILQASALL